MGVIARQSIKGALANYLGVAIGFVTTFFVVTRMLTAEEVGLTRMMVDAAMLFSSLAQLGSCSMVVKFFPHFSKSLSEGVTKSLSEGVTKWRSGGVGKWRSGGVGKWRSGEVTESLSGGVGKSPSGGTQPLSHLATQPLKTTQPLSHSNPLSHSKPLSHLATQPLKTTQNHSATQSPYHGIFGWAMAVPLAGFALFALLFVLFRGPLTDVYVGQAPMLAGYLYMLPMLTFSALYMTVLETGASVLMRITVPKLVREVGVRLLNLAAYLLYGLGVVSLDGFVWLFCGSYAAAMLLDLVYLLAINGFDLRILRIERGFVDRRLMAEMVRYSLFMTVTVMAGCVPLFGSLFLGARAGAATAGVYAIASYMANVVEVPYRSLGAISRPVVAAAVKNDDWAEVNRLGRQVSLHQLMVSLLIFYAIWINLDALFALLPNGAQYRGGAVVVLVLGLAKVLNSTLAISIDVLNFSRSYVWGLLFIGVLTAAALLLNAPLIDAVGVGGAACATLASYVLYYGLMLVFLRRRVGFSPFGGGQLKMVALTAAMFGLDALWRAVVAPLFGGAVVADAIAKSAVLLGTFCAVAYMWNISPTVNAIAQKTLRSLGSLGSLRSLKTLKSLKKN